MTRRHFTDLSPREAKIRHAIRRFFQRRGIMLSLPEYEQIVGTIRNGEAEQKCEAKNGCTAHLIKFRDKEAVAIFDPANDCIVTFLPTLEWVRPARVGV